MQTAAAAGTGVYGAQGKDWLIEGHGVDPDIVVDHLPHATYEGSDAQLQASIDRLQQELQANPYSVLRDPPYPNKSFQHKQ